MCDELSDWLRMCPIFFDYVVCCSLFVSFVVFVDFGKAFDVVFGGGRGWKEECGTRTLLNHGSSEQWRDEMVDQNFHRDCTAVVGK